VQNFPFFSTVQLGDDGFLTIKYRLTSDPRVGSPTVYPVRVQFYKADTFESGEGRPHRFATAGTGNVCFIGCLSARDRGLNRG
jgi:hypothetical protein